MTGRRCFLADIPGAGPCDGRLVRAHLVRRQVLRKELNAGPSVMNDPRGYVWACGGPTGAAGHHGALDWGGVNRLHVPYDRLPQEFIDWMEELGLGWWTRREYL